MPLENPTRWCQESPLGAHIWRRGGKNTDEPYWYCRLCKQIKPLAAPWPNEKGTDDA